MINYAPGQIVSVLDGEVVTMRQELLLTKREGRRERHEASSSVVDEMRTQVVSDPLRAWGMGVLMANQQWAESVHGLLLPQSMAQRIHETLALTACVGIHAYTGRPVYREVQL